LNSELVKQALAKVGNPNVLVNLVSRRVRQLTTGGSEGRPLLADTAGMGAADLALLEIIEDKMAFEILENPEEAQPAAKKRKRS
jgi:DNA-directed RNA polymerase subunit omega